MRITNWMGALALLGCIAATAPSPANAGDENGDFMIKVLGSVVDPDSSADVYGSAGLVPGADAKISTEVIPALTLTYFLDKNWAVELFCCFAKMNAKGKDALAGADLGDFWIFPPALTLQYHFDDMGGFKPYVGAGLQYIHFFD